MTPRCEDLPATKRQLQVLDYIRQHIAEHGYAPAYREIVKHFKWSTPNAVTCHITALVRKGLLRQTRGLARTLVPVEVTDG
jgi:repressor LexA